MSHTLKYAALFVVIAAMFVVFASTSNVHAAPLQDEPTQAGGKGGERPQGGGQAPSTQDRRERGAPAEPAVDDDESAGNDNSGAAGIPRERAPSPQDVGDPSDPETQTARKVMLEEAKYRNRTAKLNRLRELAQAQGNEQRLRAIDQLEQRMAEQHDRKIERAKAQLGKRFDKVNERLERGRGKKSDKPGKPSEASGGTGKQKPDAAGQSPKRADEPVSPRGQGRGGDEATQKDPGAQGGGKPGNRPGTAPPDPDEKKPARGEPQGKGNEPGGKGGGKPQGDGGKGGKP